MSDRTIPILNTSACNEKNARCSNASDIIKEDLLSYCRTQEERWKEAFLNLADNDPNSKHKTILKGIIKDIIEEPDSQKARKICEQEFGESYRQCQWEDEIDIYMQYFSNIKDISQFNLSHKTFCILMKRARSTIINWYEGNGLPKYRDDVIKLAFWAKCTIKETNKLLECAGKHRLYVKGAGDTYDNRDSLVDTVYIHMLRHGNYSFADAQGLIKEMNRVIQEEIKAQNERGSIVLEHTPSSNSGNLEKLLKKVKNSDISFLNFIRKHVDSFVYNYQTLYDILYSDFEEQYDINNKGVESHRKYSNKSSLNSLLGISAGPKRRWKNSLVKIIYAAIPQKAKQTALTDTDYHTISRKDLIVLGLILNWDLTKINMVVLPTCKEAPIYGRGIKECLLWNAFYTGAELHVDEFPEKANELYESECIYTIFKTAVEKTSNTKFGNDETSKQELIAALNKHLLEYETLYYEHEYYMPPSVIQRKKSRNQINKEYNHKFPCCNALHSLKVFEWIKSTVVELNMPIVTENMQEILELYPEKQLFDYIVSFIAQEMEESHL